MYKWEIWNTHFTSSFLPTPTFHVFTEACQTAHRMSRIVFCSVEVLAPSPLCNPTWEVSGNGCLLSLNFPGRSPFNVESEEMCWVILSKIWFDFSLNGCLTAGNGPCVYVRPGESVIKQISIFPFYDSRVRRLECTCVFVIISQQETEQHAFSHCSTTSAHSVSAGFQQSSRLWRPPGGVIFQVI